MKNNRMIFALLITLISFVGATGWTATPEELAQEKKLSAEYLAQMAAEPNAQVIDRGIVIRSIFTSPSVDFAQASDTVKVFYHLTNREGVLIEESLTADELVEFRLDKLIPCWVLAVPKMPIGSLYKVSCPSDTAYGDKGTSDGSIKPGAALTFRMTVYGVAKP